MTSMVGVQPDVGRKRNHGSKAFLGAKGSVYILGVKSDYFMCVVGVYVLCIYMTDYIKAGCVSVCKCVQAVGVRECF